MIKITYFGIDRVLKVLNGTPPDNPGLIHDGDQNTKKVILPLLRIVRKFSAEMEDFQKAKKAVLNKHLDGREVTEEAEKELNENEEFLEEWQDLHNTEVVVQGVQRIDPEALRGVPVATLLALDPILLQEDED